MVQRLGTCPGLPGNQELLEGDPAHLSQQPSQRERIPLLFSTRERDEFGFEVFGVEKIHPEEKAANPTCCPPNSCSNQNSTSKQERMRKKFPDINKGQIFPMDEEVPWSHEEITTISPIPFFPFLWETRRCELSGLFNI